MSDRKIARALNISRPVVAQYLKEFTATGLTYEDITPNERKKLVNSVILILEKPFR